MTVIDALTLWEADQMRAHAALKRVSARRLRAIRAEIDRLLETEASSSEARDSLTRVIRTVR